ncbi:flagellar biosynthetic protein FliR [Alkalispirochaeta sphaeroplastigenens]|uniref:Flagellar biosynthetic protein FliR n=1 Tax=Alkalispirochaeta sphaeroplastigenens TaxID=1187066 RepID=A0A2S4JYX5_9SPIO|nr:flagellar biosynthetic protein FliR [Alkalispirochaeta sphaeroplastigenens]POR04709.1 flagellar biosynthetic protein FliR [Alkalispirochaeta sphaeroplastigenens]
MVLDGIVRNAPLFLLVFVRVYALLKVSPITSSEAIPGLARSAVAFFTAFAVLPSVIAGGYPLPERGLDFILLGVGEMLIGILTGMFLVLLFSVFQLAGQFFSLQMGFGASQVFDPLAQIEIPLVGQFLNMIAMMIFIISGGMQRIFLQGVLGTFGAMTAPDLATAGADVLPLVTGSLGRLFEQSLVLSFPILGTLFLLQVTMGLFGKAAPQMNLLMLGFPMAIALAFLLIFLTMPFLVEAFEIVIDGAFDQIDMLFSGSPGGAAAPEVTP